MLRFDVPSTHKFSHYKTSSLHSIRAGINRYLKSEYHEVIDITKDIEFTHANVAFKAATVQLKKIGKGFVQHHNCFENGDLQLQKLQWMKFHGI